jgi:hypothetical protein
MTRTVSLGVHEYEQLRMGRRLWFSFPDKEITDVSIEFPVDTPGIVARNVWPVIDELIGTQETGRVSLFLTAGTGLDQKQFRQLRYGKQTATRIHRNPQTKLKKTKRIKQHKPVGVASITVIRASFWYGERVYLISQKVRIKPIANTPPVLCRNAQLIADKNSGQMDKSLTFIRHIQGKGKLGLFASAYLPSEYPR